VVQGGGARRRQARYRVRGVATGTLARQGALAGGLLALPPGVGAAWVAVWLIDGAYRTLESWRAVRLPLPAGLPSPSVNYVDLLHLQAASAALRAWQAAPTATALLTVLAVVAAGALFGAATGLVIAGLANLGAAVGGAAVIELEEVVDEG
jgi:hypothetical protein